MLGAVCVLTLEHPLVLLLESPRWVRFLMGEVPL